MSNYTGGVNNRRTRALSRLREQLSVGTKSTNVKGISEVLSDKDIARINKEITTLQSRV